MKAISSENPKETHMQHVNEVGVGTHFRMTKASADSLSLPQASFGAGVLCKIPTSKLARGGGSE